MLVCRRADGAILGFFNLSHITRGSLQSAYLGYAVGSKFANQGYMREGLDLVVRRRVRDAPVASHRGQHPTREPGVDRAGAGRRLHPARASPPRYLKIGGRWRDHKRGAILAEDWRGRDFAAWARERTLTPGVHFR